MTTNCSISQPPDGTVATVSVAELTTEKRQLFVQTVSALLSTGTAERAFGQIVDGLTTSENYKHMRMTVTAWRPEMEGHTQPSEKTIMVFRALREQLNLEPSDVDVEVKILIYS